MKMKKLAVLLMSGVLAFSMLTGCGDDADVADDQQVEEVQDDAEDVEEDVVEEDNEVEAFDVDALIANATGVDIYEIYMTISGEEAWGDNLLEEDTYLPAGHALPLVLTINSQEGVLWDLQVVDGEGTEIDFYEIDITEMPLDGFAIELAFDDEGTPTAKLATSFEELEGEYETAE